MKNQYFGDQRDYFKFDLMIELATQVLERPRFTNVVMLTPNDDSGQGGAVNYGMGNGTPSLYHFLQCHAHLPNEEREVVSLRDYFADTQTDVEYLPYADVFPHFAGKSREAYFTGIPPEWLENAIILVDPDVGLTPPSGKASSNKHTTAIDLAQLKNRMGTAGVLVLFQFKWRRTWQYIFEYIQRSFMEQEDDGHFCAVHDGNLAFICITKDPRTQAAVRRCLRNYGNENGLSLDER